MKLKNLYKKIAEFEKSDIYFEFTTDVKEYYNESSNNLKYCYISDITTHKESNNIIITLCRDLDNKFFIYKDDFINMLDDLDKKMDVNFYYQIERDRNRKVEIDNIYTNDSSVKINFTELK